MSACACCVCVSDNRSGKCIRLSTLACAHTCAYTQHSHYAPPRARQGVNGLRNPSADVRQRAASLLGGVLIFAASSAAEASTATTAGLPLWPVLTALLCDAATTDTHPHVRAAALLSAAPLLGRALTHQDMLPLYVPTSQHNQHRQKHPQQAQQQQQQAQHQQKRSPQQQTQQHLQQLLLQISAPLTALLASLSDPKPCVRDAAVTALSHLPSSMLHKPLQKHSSSSNLSSSSLTAAALSGSTDSCVTLATSTDSSASLLSSHSTNTNAPLTSNGNLHHNKQPLSFAVSTGQAPSPSLSAAAQISTAQPPARPSLDASHPLIAWLLRCFCSAPCHEYGPLAAFKAPGSVVRAVASVLQVRLVC